MAGGAAEVREQAQARESLRWKGWPTRSFDLPTLLTTRHASTSLAVEPDSIIAEPDIIGLLH